MNPKILHICNGYSTSRLYDEFMSRLADRYDQTVISPTYKLPTWEANGYRVQFFMRKESLITRLQYGRKLQWTLQFIEERNNLEDFSVIHAHTLFTDGIPAYWINTKYGISYVVAIRNSDINVFFKYFVHYRRTAYKVLLNASAIILISPIYKQRLKEILPAKIFDLIEDKLKIIPNGINSEWLKHRASGVKTIEKQCNIIFCGRFIKGKNIVGLIDAFNKVSKVHKNATLTLVGLQPYDNNRNIKRIKKLAIQNRGRIIITTSMAQDELMSLYRECHIFAMPSHAETFGLVYAEALSQGLPIIYTKREGFDGFYPDSSVGVAVNSHSIDSIADGIYSVISNYQHFAQNVQSLNLSNFDWNQISLRYASLYKEISRIT